MEIHPLPKKRNTTIQYEFNPSTMPKSHKKLRRLPHIFSRVLELPFRSEADVAVEENPDCFKFVAKTEQIGSVSAQTIEIHPGVTKIVIRPIGHGDFGSVEETGLDVWRFRLPDSTRPELARAVCEGGELIVTVPKGREVVGAGRWADNNNGCLVLAQ